MALVSIKARSELGTTDVLAPERYDPRRALDSSAISSILLGDIVRLVRNVVQPSADLGRCLVLDTSDVREGVVIARKMPVDGPVIGSSKKSIQPHDVIISRLRPYLRQVAFVDENIPGTENAILVGSTEFYVLRSPDKRSIAFLVPFLLSQPVQQVLSASQEGGHHPRFDDLTLRTLPVPRNLLEDRDTISVAIERAAQDYRRYERGVDGMISKANNAFS